MTMTDERLAELDAVMAKATAGEWERDVFFIRAKDEAHASDIAQCFKGHRDSFNCATANAAAIVALHNAYPDLRAHIDAQAATIARLTDAITKEARAAEMSANIMRDGRRTGNWAGAEGTAKAFDRIKTALRAALTGAA